ncbi:hypothetical protein ACIQF8_16485 [Pseudarthrobacter sp. NPDC092184]|uniref:hypothetical protein n=1 Tax=Pseudarthrobacter sp. NPDC092184 TaxID=3364410 RepID=UPI003822B70F
MDDWGAADPTVITGPLPAVVEWLRARLSAVLVPAARGTLGTAHDDGRYFPGVSAPKCPGTAGLDPTQVYWRSTAAVRIR